MKDENTITAVLLVIFFLCAFYGLYDIFIA
jgi:hypothetical protein